MTKRIYQSFLLSFCVFSIFALAGCGYGDYDLANRVDDLEGRMAALEAKVSALNDNVVTLSDLMNGKMFIESVVENGDGSRTINFITFNGEKKSMVIRDGKDGQNGADGKDGLNGQDGKDGKDGQNGADGKDGQNGKDGVDGKDGLDGSTPVVSVRQDSDGNWYWTVNGSWLIVDGKKVRANGIDGIDGKDGQDGKDGVNGADGKDGKDGQDGKDGKDGQDGQDGQDGKDGANGADGQNGIAPAFRIENGRWMVSVDRGLTWTDCGQATGSNGDSFFKDAQQSPDGKYAYLTLADGTVLTFEIYNKFDIAFEIGQVLVQEGQTRDINFIVTGMTSSTIVEAIGKGGWDADAEIKSDGNGVLTVKAPSTPGVGKIIVFAHDGGTKTVMRTLTFVSGIVNVSDQTVEIDNAGGTRKISVETDLDFRISVPEDCNWVKVTQTRALRTEYFDVVIEKSDNPDPRSALITIEAENGLPIESILVVQKPAVFDKAHAVFRYDPRKSNYDYISLPISALSVKGGKLYVDWGDGSDVQTIAATSASATSLTGGTYPKHTYEDKDRVYSVQIWGDWAVVAGGNQNYCAGLVEVAQWGSMKFTSIQFNNPNLVAVAGPTDDTQFSELKSLSFSGCKGLERINPNLLKGAVKLTGFNSTFKNCESLTEIPEGFFDPIVELSGSLQEMFYGCHNLKAVRSSFKNVTNTGNAIYTTSLIGVFRDCYALEEVPENFFPETLWNRTVTITNFFANCKSLKKIPDGFFKGMGEGKNSQGKPHACSIMNYAFSNCESLESVNLDFLNTPGGLMFTNFGSTFENCVNLKVAPPVYKFTYDGQTYDVPIWKRVDMKKSADTNFAAAVKEVFGTSTSSQSTNCFKNCNKMPGWNNIPDTWGGGYCGYDKAPTLVLTAQPTKDAEYYSIDFNIKTTDAQAVSYYLASVQQINTYLPRYNNSMEEMVTKNGKAIEDSYNAPYLTQCNTEEGLTLYYDGGMPEIKFGVIAIASNPLGKVVKYVEVSTTKMPKGSDAFENFVGTWTVTAASTLIEEYDENGDPIDVGPTSFDITLEPERVNESYFMTGWGYNKFRKDRPIRAIFNPQNSQFEIWCGQKGAVQLMTNYQYKDEQSKFSQYTVTYYPYLEDPKDHALNYYSYGGSTGECVLAGAYLPSANRAVLSGQRSTYNSSAQYGDVYWVGMEVVLTMGSMSGSQTYTPLGIIDPNLIVTYKGKQYVPHAVGPYTMTRKSANVSAAAKKASAKKAAPIQKQTYNAKVKKTSKVKK